MKCLNTPGTKYCVHLTLFWLFHKLLTGHWPADRTLYGTLRHEHGGHCL